MLIVVSPTSKILQVAENGASFWTNAVLIAKKYFAHLLEYAVSANIE